MIDNLREEGDKLAKELKEMADGLAPKTGAGTKIDIEKVVGALKDSHSEKGRYMKGSVDKEPEIKPTLIVDDGLDTLKDKGPNMTDEKLEQVVKGAAEKVFKDLNDMFAKHNGGEGVGLPDIKIKK